MKLFFQRSSRITYFNNILITLLCTSYLFTGYIVDVNKEPQQEKPTNVVQNDTEAVSQSGKSNNKKVTKVTKIVSRKDVNTSNKEYTPAKYNAVTGQAIVDYAKLYLGLRYVSGGYSLETGTDCSGFTKLIYKEFGVSLSRSARGQAKNGSYIRKSDLQKGDLVFYGYGDGTIRHVAIYIGNGKVIHESNREDGVKISSVNMMEYITARRVINEKANQIVEDKNKQQEETYTESDYQKNEQENNSQNDVKDEVTNNENSTSNNNETTEEKVTDDNIVDNNVYTQGEY